MALPPWVDDLRGNPKVYGYWPAGERGNDAAEAARTVEFSAISNCPAARVFGDNRRCLIILVAAVGLRGYNPPAWIGPTYRIYRQG